MLRSEVKVQDMHDHHPRPAAGRSPNREDQPQLQPDGHEQHQGSHSMLWMVACCAPMVLLAVAILLGVFGPR